MHLVQILLPLANPCSSDASPRHYEQLTHLLTEHFGGVTAFMRSPAEGRWKEGHAIQIDNIVVIEVMTDELDRSWWSALRLRLMKEFGQEDIVIRSQQMELLT